MMCTSKSRTNDFASLLLVYCENYFKLCCVSVVFYQSRQLSLRPRVLFPKLFPKFDPVLLSDCIVDSPYQNNFFKRTYFSQ